LVAGENSSQVWDLHAQARSSIYLFLKKLWSQPGRIRLMQENPAANSSKWECGSNYDVTVRR
jgi:hypothetical protein